MCLNNARIFGRGYGQCSQFLGSETLYFYSHFAFLQVFKNAYVGDWWSMHELRYLDGGL